MFFALYYNLRPSHRVKLYNDFKKNVDKLNFNCIMYKIMNKSFIRIEDEDQRMVCLCVKWADLNDNLSDKEEGSVKDKYLLAKHVILAEINRMVFAEINSQESCKQRQEILAAETNRVLGRI